MSDSTEHNVDPEGWATLTLADLGITLQIPLGWEAFPDSHQVTFQGEPDPATEYRPTAIVRVGEPAETGRDWWQGFTEQIVGVMIDTAPGFEFRSQDEFTIPQGGEAYFVTALWGSESPELPQTAQLQGWIWAGSYLIYQLSTSTDAANADRDLPIFEQILRSIRLIPMPQG